MNLRDLFSVKEILLSRGFEVIKEDNYDKLLITEQNMYDEIWSKLFQVFDSLHLRTELKSHVYKKIVPTSEEVIEITKHKEFKSEYQRFNNTFEWFAGELMINRFAAFSASYGVEVRDIIRNSTMTEAGDFDALVVLRDTNLAYFECKAGSFDGSDILKCYERMLALNCEFSIMFCVENIDEAKLIWDTSKIQVPMILTHELNKVNIKGKADYVYELNNCYIIDMSGNIENKIRTALRVNTAKINSIHHMMTPDESEFDKLGYVVKTIDTQRYPK